MRAPQFFILETSKHSRFLEIRNTVIPGKTHFSRQNHNTSNFIPFLFQLQKSGPAANSKKQQFYEISAMSPPPLPNGRHGARNSREGAH